MLLRRCISLRDKIQQQKRGLFLDVLILSSFWFFYLVSTCFLAHRKLLWTDELFTYYIATRPTWQESLLALCDGPDLSPPLNHLVTRLIITALGPSHIAVRLAPILGFGIMATSLYFYSRRISGPLESCVALISPFLTLAYFYAYEARPYGLFLGFSGLVLLCWQRAVHSRKSIAWSAALSISLAACLATHWFGVLAWIPIILAEMVRSFHYRKLDGRIWLSFVAAAVVISFLLPFIDNARGTQDLWQSPVALYKIAKIYFDILDYGALFLIFVMAALFLGFSRNASLQMYGWTTYEKTAIAGFVLFPFLGWLLGVLLTGIVLLRYVLPTVIGITLLFTTLCFLLKRQGLSSSAFLSALLFLAGLKVWSAKMDLDERSMVAEREGVFALFRISQPNDHEVIAIPDIHSYNRLFFYATPIWRERLVFIEGVNPLTAKSARQLARWGKAKVTTVDELAQSNQPFYLYEVGDASILPQFAQYRFLMNPVPLGPSAEFPRPGRLYRLEPLGH